MQMPPVPSASNLEDRTQWHAAVFVGGELLNSRYPTNAPTATASMTQPLYVMKSSLVVTRQRFALVVLRAVAGTVYLHDEEGVKDLDGIQQGFHHLGLLLASPSSMSPWAKQ